ncbi:MAG: hypothetical protein ACR2O4_09770 [Hyphomicrobiaceae bacterium]
MFEIFGERFFQALHMEAKRTLGADHPCVLAAARAADTGEQSDIVTAQTELAALPAEEANLLMASVHKAMREDPQALLENWRGPDTPFRHN